MDDFRADAQTGHVIHETPKQIWRALKNEKKNRDLKTHAVLLGRRVEPVCPLSRGLCTDIQVVLHDPWFWFSKNVLLVLQRSYAF